MKKLGTVFSFIFVFALILFAISASGEGAIKASAAVATPTEATDVYWAVSGNTLVLSGELGNSGLAKWEKSSVAAVNNAASVPWNSYRSSITRVMYYGVLAPTSTAFWFAETGITEFSVMAEGSVYLDMSFVTDMSRMFSSCSSLTSIDFGTEKAPLVKNIESAFDGCSKLKSLDLSLIFGAPLENMMNAFYGCSTLKVLDVSGLDISAVTDFTAVFKGCSSLTALDLSALDGRNITTLESSFENCEKLSSLTFGERFTAEKVTSLKRCFYGCSSLTSLDLSYVNTARVTDMSNAFTYCTVLESITLGEGFKLSAVTTIEKAFVACKALTSIDTSGWDAKNVKNMSGAFANCTSLSYVDLSGFDEARPTAITSLFSGCTSLTEVDMSVIDTSLVTSLRSLFDGCSALTSFDLASIDTSSVTTMERIFYGCTSLTEFSLRGVNLSSVTDISYMFNGCLNLESIDLTGIDTSAVTSASKVFSNCTSLTLLDLSDFDVNPALYADDLVDRSTKLGAITAPASIPEGVTITLGIFEFFDGTNEVKKITAAHAGKTLVGKFEIAYFWKLGNQNTNYTLEPNFYYYGTGAEITASISSDGYEFGGWTRSGSTELVTSIAPDSVGRIVLYAVMTPYKVVKPQITVSEDVEIEYGEGIDVSMDFTESELHTYTVSWYRTTASGNYGGIEIPALRNMREFSISPYHFEYGLEIEKELYFYCEISAKRTDNGLTEKVRSETVRVYVKRAQAKITVHPEAIPGLVYNGKEQTVVTAGEGNHGTRTSIAYSFYEDGPFYNTAKWTNAGTGTVYYKIVGNNYFIGTEVYTLHYAIAPAVPTISWIESATEEYSGGEVYVDDPIVTLLNGEIYDGELIYTHSGTSSGKWLPVNVGEYTVTVTVPASGNYAEVSASITMTVTKADPDIEELPTANSGLVYDGGEQVLVTNGTVLGGYFEFSLDGVSWADEPPAVRNAGEYTVYYKVVGDSNHNDGESGSLTVSVARRTITIRPKDVTACDGDIPTEFEYTVKWLATGDELITEPSLTLIPSSNQGMVIAPEGADAGDNYEIVYELGIFKTREHAWDEGVIAFEPTCTDGGVRLYTCKHDAEHTKTEDIPVNTEAHEWNDGEITTAPTCTEGGVRTFTCAHDSAHTKTEAVDALGHAYDNACDASCNTCGEAREAPAHVDADENGECDVCAANLKNGAKGGVIAVIVIASVALLATGGIVIYMFILKKKKM